jgi:[ribosomal protein S18]-alanine N-acetyltransferase
MIENTAIHRIDVVVTTASHRDVPSIREIECDAFSSPWSEDSLTKLVDVNSGSFALVARSATTGEALGYVGVLQAVDQADITNIAVLHAYRGLGVGRALITSLFETCRVRGILTLFLEAREGNLPAIALYSHNGFVVSGRRRGYYQDTGEDAVLFTKEITSI